MSQSQRAIIATEAEIDAAAVRAIAMAALNGHAPMPAVITAIRRAQAIELRDKRTVARGMTDAALTFFWSLTIGYRRPGADIDMLVFDVALTPEHRRMFPELPEVDGVSVWSEKGQVKFEFYDVEWRR